MGIAHFIRNVQPGTTRFTVAGRAYLAVGAPDFPDTGTALVPSIRLHHGVPGQPDTVALRFGRDHVTVGTW